MVRLNHWKRVLLIIIVGVIGCAGVLQAKPKNVIFLIGDGMGPEQVKAAAIYAYGAPGTLSFELFPYQGRLTTYSANSSIPDSAAAATAMATGFKVNNDVISMAYPGDGSELETLLEYYKSLYKSTGLVSTSYLTDATPAAFGAHEPTRSNTSAIAGDYLNQTQPNVLLGGGGNGMTTSEFASAGYTVVTDRAGMLALNTETVTKVSGQFGGGQMPYEYDGLQNLPHLSEMTATALSILDNDTDGFFLMVEGGNIDHACHSSDLARTIPEVSEFADAVQVAVNWAAGRNDTLILVAADHETGGLTVTANNGAGVLPSVTWGGAGGHTAANVPVYAWGVNAELISGVMDNTNMFGVVVSDEPIELVNPAYGAANVSTSPSLEARVRDPDGTGDPLDVTFFGRENPSFTIVVLPDTQKYVLNGAYPQIFTSQTQWIVDNAVSENIVFMTHEGDVIDTWNSTTEWGYANNSISLLDGVVPYGLAVGNHDKYENPADPMYDTVSTYFNQTFPYTRYESEPWYGGHYPAAPDPNGNSNNYQLFSAGGDDYIVLHLEDYPTPAVIAWADGVLKANSSRKAIITTHGYMDTGGNYAGKWGSTQYIRNLVVGNDNVYFVLCGHFGGEYAKTTTVNGRLVHEMLADYQDRANGGDGWLRILRFEPDEDKVYVRTYSTWHDAYEADSGSQFTLDFPMSSSAFTAIGTNSGVVSGANTSLTWPGRKMETKYEWYVTVTDSTPPTTVGPVWSFTTGSRKASSPNPADGAINVQADADISWSAGVDAVSHDVYFGTNPGNLPRVSQLQSGTTYDPSTLQQGTTYYWAIDEFDSGGNLLAAGDIWSFTTTVPGPLTFQQGVNGYTGMVDTMIRSPAPTTNYADSAVNYDSGYQYQYNADTSTGSPAGPSHVLLRFDDIIGGSPGQIPAGSTILSATLRLRTMDASNGGKLHRLLQSWTATTITWANSFGGNGIQADGSEAAVSQDDGVASTSGAGDTDLNVTATVQGYVDGTITNNGWALLPNGSDGWHIAAAEHPTVDYRPELIVTFTPGNQAPVAIDDNTSTDEDIAVIVNVLANDSDPDDDPLSIASVTQGASGTVGINPDNTVTYTPNPNFNGIDTFTYQAADGTANSNSATVTVTVNNVDNDPPVAVQDSIATDEDIPVVINVLANDSDPEGATLSVSSVTQPSNGTVVNNGTDVRYTPKANFNGSDSFTYTANDGTYDSSITTVTITVNSVNDTPLANSQSVTTAEDAAVDITLTGTDSDGDLLTYSVVTGPSNGTLSGTCPNLTYTPNSNFNGSDSFNFTVNDGTADSEPATVSITIEAVNDAPAADNQAVTAKQSTAKDITLTASDVEEDPLTYAVLSPPTSGTLSGTAPNLTYTPNAGFTGSDSFTFKATDGTRESNVAMVSITVTANNPPVANNQSVTTDEDTPAAVTLTGTDADGDPLTYAVLSPPTRGTLSGTAPNLTYTPNPNYNGANSFTFKVNDGIADSSPATVSITITAINDPPTADAQSVTTPEDTPVAIILTGSDAEGDPLSYIVLTQPSYGTLSGTAPNLTYTPNANYNGSDSFTFKVNDGTADSAPATVGITVTPVNDPPSADAGTDQAVSDSDGTGSETVTLTGSGSDTDGTIASYEWKEGGATIGTAQIIRPVLSVGVHAITLTVADNGGATGSDDVIVTVNANQTPTANAGTDQTVTDSDHSGSESVTLSGSGADADGTIVAYQWKEGATPLGTGQSINVDLAIGEHTITLTVTDNGGATRSDNVVVTVKEGPAAIDDTANSDIIVSGTITSGSYVSTANSDNVYEAIREIRQGTTSTGRSLLEHKWTINVTGGSAVSFHVEAYRTANSEGDNFVFAYSTDNLTYTNLLTVTKTADNNTLQSATLPSTLSGTVYIRVQDTDRTKGRTSLDTIYIDQMFIRSQGFGPDTSPPSPNPMTWGAAPHATSSTSISMTATTAFDPSGVEYYFDCLTAGGHDSAWQSNPSYEDTGLSPNTTYTYTVTARDLSANHNQTAASTAESATTNPAPEWTELTYDDFELGWGHYTDGGGDCSRYTAGTYAHQGSSAANVQDNSGTASSFFYTNGVDVHTPGYTQIKVEFWFYAVSMETGEDFWLQYYDGSTWRTVKAWASGTDFSNGTFYNPVVYINEAGYTLPTNMKIRFMCDASDNDDDVYIDEVRVSAK